MMKNNNISLPKDIKLTGRTRTQIISIMGNEYVEDTEGSLIYTLKYFLFIKKKIYIGFDENDVANVVFTL